MMTRKFLMKSLIESAKLFKKGELLVEGLKKDFEYCISEYDEEIVTAEKLPQRATAIRFGRWILKHAESHIEEDGTFSWKRPNGKIQKTAELWKEFEDEGLHLAVTPNEVQK